RHATTSRKSAWRYSPWRAKLRSQAMRKRAILMPLVVVRSSGSATRRPMIATTFNIRQDSSYSVELVFPCDDQGAHDALGDRVHTVQCGGEVGLAGEIDHRVDALVLVVDGVGQTALAPLVDGVDRTVGLDQGLELTDQSGGSLVVEGGGGNQHGFVLCHFVHLLLDIRASDGSQGSAGLPAGPSLQTAIYYTKRRLDCQSLFSGFSGGCSRCIRTSLPLFFSFAHPMASPAPCSRRVRTWQLRGPKTPSMAAR